MMAPHSISLFCFGLGYSAQALAARLRAQDIAVTGCVREPAKAEALRARGIDAVVFSDSSAVQARLSTASHVLTSVPPEAAGDPVLVTYAGALAEARCGWLGYLSTTGVYGDHAGGWVDETTPLAPLSPRAERRAEAERAWQTLAARSGAMLSIFRLPGIYGPGRSAIDALQAGTARRIDKQGQVFSRIHVEDLAAGVAQAVARNAAGIFNLCDDEPAPQADVIAYAARLLGIAPPPLEAFADAAPRMSEIAKSFYGESKRVTNAKMKRELGVTLRYPTYRDGLAAQKAAP